MKGSKVNGVPPVDDIIIIFVGYIYMFQLYRSTLRMRMKFYGHNRLFRMFTKIPLLNNFFTRFKFYIFTRYTSIPQGKLRIWFGRHLGWLTRPKLKGGGICQSQVDFIWLCWNDIIFFKVFHEVLGCEVMKLATSGVFVVISIF